jgi:outer membrane protein OmpA-like peptidoglycan-associated protein
MMSFDYDQLKSKEGSDGSFWASYSDLFMVLSLVFLLLYVVSGLRSGTNGVMQQLEFEKLKQENADYKEQIKAYNTLKEDYLTQGATKSETETYDKLMSKLELLQSEAKDEKNNLTKAAKENAEKEEALNQYQQIVRNIINTNMLSAARMKRKTKVIKKIDQDLELTKVEVKELNKTVALKEQEIEKREKDIEWVQDNLEKTVAKLEKSFKDKKLTKRMMQKKISRLKLKASQKVDRIQAKSDKIKSELESAQSKLTQANETIDSKDSTIATQSREIAGLAQEQREAEDQIENLKESFESQRDKAQKAFKAKLQSSEMSAREKDKQINEFRDKMAGEKAQFESKLSGLEGEIEKKSEALGQAKAEAEAALGEAESAKNAAGLAEAKANALGKDLKEAKAIINAKKKLIGKIADNLKKAGLNASVDKKTGDVVLAFGKEYFDTGKANLKPSMREMLEKFMPVYSKSLLSDKETAKKIKSVEVIGFASPTYKGKYVDPVSLKAGDRKAAGYNLDLSYYRARAIYEHIFDKTKMKYQYQKDLLPLVKVVGRSYFAQGADRNIASKMSQEEYCSKFDCKKAQKVIIKFDIGN